MKHLYLLLLLVSFQLKAQDTPSVLSQKDSLQTKLKTPIEGHAVIGFFNDTLFKVHNDIGGFSALERATAVNERIQQLKELEYNSNLFSIRNDHDNTQVIYGSKVLLAISDQDAAVQQVDRKTLATSYMNTISEAYRIYKDETSLYSLLKNIGIALIIVIITFFTIKYALKLFRLISIKIYEQKNKRIKGIKIRNYTLFDAKSQVNALINLIL